MKKGPFIFHFSLLWKSYLCSSNLYPCISYTNKCIIVSFYFCEQIFKFMIKQNLSTINHYETIFTFNLIGLLLYIFKLIFSWDFCVGLFISLTFVPSWLREVDSWKNK